MDLRLPDADGTEAVRILREEPSTSRIPVVALTALLARRAGRMVVRGGFAGYIAKPIDIDELPDLVRGFAAAGPTEASRAGRLALDRRGCQHPRDMQAGTVGLRPRASSVRSLGAEQTVRIRAAGGRSRGVDLMGRKSLRVRSPSWRWPVALVALALAAYAGNVLATPGSGVRRDHAREGDLRRHLLARARQDATVLERGHPDAGASPTSTSSRTRGSPVAAPAGTRTRARASSSSPRGA